MGLIIDSFAGGGGASTGIEMALGRSPDIAINHDAEALAMHAANHPGTLHLSRNIWQVDPLDHVGNRPVDLAWFSPDCKHHSKAKGGKPVKRNIRDLAWVVVLWARRVRPAVIMLENVEEFRDWGPLVERDGKLYPCPDRKGETFRRWVGELKRLGYRVEWRNLRACDHGAPTIRRRLFLIARRDGRPIIWPKPSHGPADDADVIAGRKQPWRTAAEIIDWSLPCPSIFDTKEQILAKHGLRAQRPLADATMRRIARGVVRYVLQAKRPFIVPLTHTGDSRVHAIDEPLRKQTTANRGEHALVVPHIMTMRNSGKPWTAADEPVHTVTASGAYQFCVAAFLAQHNSERCGVNPGRPVHMPMSTLTARGTQQNLVAAHLINMKGGDRAARGLDEPSPTVCAGAGHAGLIAAFLMKYYGADQNPRLDMPMHTDTTKPRFGLVSVAIEGEPYVLADIGMRMLTPRERFRAQGFPDRYIIDRGGDGARLTETAQGRMCGNSVCPPLAEALVRANCAALAVAKEAA